MRERMTEEECEAMGGHCWVGDPNILLSNPPTYIRSCKHCGKVQYGKPQDAIDWRDR